MRRLWPVAVGLAAIAGLLFAPLLAGDTQLFLEFFPPLATGLIVGCIGFVALLMEQREGKKPGS